MIPDSDPVALSREQLLSLVDEMRASIAAGDAFEGRLVYETASRGEYLVDTFFRIGNLMGQGGAVMVTTKPRPHEAPLPEPPDPGLNADSACNPFLFDYDEDPEETEDGMCGKCAAAGMSCDYGTCDESCPEPCGA